MQVRSSLNFLCVCSSILLFAHNILLLFARNAASLRRQTRGAVSSPPAVALLSRELSHQSRRGARVRPRAARRDGAAHVLRGEPPRARRRDGGALSHRAALRSRARGEREGLAEGARSSGGRSGANSDGRGRGASRGGDDDHCRPAHARRAPHARLDGERDGGTASLSRHAQGAPPRVARRVSQRERRPFKRAPRGARHSHCRRAAVVRPGGVRPMRGIDARRRARRWRLRRARAAPVAALLAPELRHHPRGGVRDKLGEVRSSFLLFALSLHFFCLLIYSFVCSSILLHPRQARRGSATPMRGRARW